MDRGSIHDTLKRYWGYDSFRAKQEEIINSVLLGKDTLGLLPTGGGKSITFQVPAMLLDGLTIVVTPLIALMKDQADGLRDRHINAAYIHSGLRHGEIRNVIDRCVFGKCKFLYISPERLASSSFIESLRRMKVSLIVVDEAHCISQWGYDFRPSYLNIASIRQLFPDAPVLALTASATPAVVADIMQQLQFKEPNVIRKSFRRDNLSYIVRHQENKTEKLFSALSRIYGSGIIYVRSRAKTKDIAEQLKSQGFSADYYHAGLTTEEKRDKQDKWKRGEIRIIVATNAFGMGIDKSDVALVVHYNMPKDLESYYQEAGRAGRDGSPARCILLYSKGDVRTAEFIIDHGREESGLTPAEQEQMENENPLEERFWAEVTVNGRRLWQSTGHGVCWVPGLPESARWDGEAEQVVAHYGLERDCGWVIWRVCCPWDGRKMTPKTAELTMTAEKMAVDGGTFTAEPGKTVLLTDPRTGLTHMLRVISLKQETMELNSLLARGMVYPRKYTELRYTLEPPLPAGEMLLQDAAPGDTVRTVVTADGLSVEESACIGIIGGADGPTVVFVSGCATGEDVRVACSAVRYEPVETVTWRVRFMARPKEDKTVALLP